MIICMLVQFWHTGFVNHKILRNRGYSMSHSKKPELENIEYYQTIALNIAYFRRLAGYTQSMLAQKAGISLPYLGTLESRNSLKPCSMEVLFDLARALDIEPYQLLMPLSEPKNKEKDRSGV